MALLMFNKGDIYVWRHDYREPVGVEFHIEQGHYTVNWGHHCPPLDEGLLKTIIALDKVEKAEMNAIDSHHMVDEFVNG